LIDTGNEEDNMDMCIDIYLATYRKEDDLELPEEIQARINELDSMIAEEDDPLDKMQIYMEIATLFLGNICIIGLQDCTSHAAVGCNFALNCSVPSHL
jgi:hypothetical protein